MLSDESGDLYISVYSKTSLKWPLPKSGFQDHFQLNAGQSIAE